MTSTLTPTFFLMLFLDPEWRKCSQFSQRASAAHAGSGVCRRCQLLGAPDGAACGHPGCSAAGTETQREGLSWPQLQQGAVKSSLNVCLSWNQRHNILFAG